MYEPETILARTEPKDNPYDRVRVVGISPIQHSHNEARGDWVGGQSQSILIEPLADFGATLDVPLGQLQELYDVESVPEHEIPVVPTVRVVHQGDPSPEDVFKAESKSDKPEPRRRKAEVVGGNQPQVSGV